MKRFFLLLLCLALFHIGFSQDIWRHGRLKVSPNGHYLEHEDGTPFFWLGDTAWELFQRLRLEEISTYLGNRQKKGFNVIQSVIIPSDGGLKIPNQYGEFPLANKNPDQPNEKYFALVDTVVKLALEKNMVMALLPAWGDKVTTMKYGGSGPVIFNADNAYRFGLFLGKRYRQYPNIVWVLGGDHPAYNESNDWRPVYRAMAKGIEDGTGKPVLISFHPGGIMWESALQVHHEKWLDFNMIQSGHSEVDQPVWETVARDWRLTPTKPVVDAEPCYEDHPIHPWPTWNPANGYFRAYEVRKQLYRSVFAGAFGVTYGHHAVWQFYSPKFKGMNHVDRYWTAAIDRPGAFQAGYLRKLITSRPFINRMPDQSLITAGQGEKGEYSCAFKDSLGKYLMVYLPVGKTVTINTSAILSAKINAWWFDPKTAKVHTIGSMKNKNTMQFTPPTTGSGNDWVLVLDAANSKFKMPE